MSSIISHSRRDFSAYYLQDLALAKTGEVPKELYKSATGYQETLDKIEELITAILASRDRKLDSHYEQFAVCLIPLSPPNQKAVTLQLLAKYGRDYTNWIYRDIILALVALHNGLSDFIYYFDTFNHALSIKGLEILLEYLVQKGSINLSCSLSSNYGEMMAAINHFCSTSHDGDKHTIIAQRDNYAHMMPLYLEKRGGTVHIVITDSKGCKDLREKEHQHALVAATLIRDKINTDSYQTHLYHPMRLHHLYCAVFALRDVVGFSKTPDFLQFVLDSERTNPVDRTLASELQQEIPHAILFQDLPRRMFKMDQSLDELRKYDQRQQEGGPSLLEELHKRIVWRIVRGEGREVNNMAMERFLKYERIVIARFLTMLDSNHGLASS